MKQIDFFANTPTSVSAVADRGARRGNWPVVLRVLLLCLLVGLGAANPARAGHFRYGGLTWRTVASDPSKLTVQFKVSQAWRRSFSAFANVTVGSTVVTDDLDFGDATSTTASTARPSLPIPMPRPATSAPPTPTAAA